MAESTTTRFIRAPRTKVYDFVADVEGLLIVFSPRALGRAYWATITPADEQAARAQRLFDEIVLLVTGVGLLHFRESG